VRFRLEWTPVLEGLIIFNLVKPDTSVNNVAFISVGTLKRQKVWTHVREKKLFIVLLQIHEFIVIS
jgi:hypothetical protein